MNVTDYFLKYVSYNTTSIDGTDEFPDTSMQLPLALYLKEQLISLGCEVTIDATHCYVYAKLKATPGYENSPCIAFISHMDTSPATSGENIHPQIIHHYDGNDIVLNKEKNIVLKTSDFPEIKAFAGLDIITTDGTTLLGADDKAGIAEIMCMLEYLHNHPDIPHGPVNAAFTPNEEVGFGTEYFNIKDFNADYAYTVDGGIIGEIQYENFNAAGAHVHFKGRSVHPGDAKNKMINAILLAQEFQALLPVHENPSSTEGYEGFYHPDRISGNVEDVSVDYIIRDHDKALFEKKKAFMNTCADFMNRKYGEGTVTIDIKDSYYNMKEVVAGHMHLIEHAKAAMENNGIVPLIVPIRGGTDGARLSFDGLVCPNLSTGGMNFHGRFEYIPVQSMETMVNVLIDIIKSYCGFEA